MGVIGGNNSFEGDIDGGSGERIVESGGGSGGQLRQHKSATQ